MKYLFFALPILMSCGRNVPDDFIDHTVLLKNDLGTLYISLPARLDTLYNHTGDSDYQCGRKEVFFFADKDYHIFNQLGYISMLEMDSMYHLSISQPKYPTCVEEKNEIGQSFLEDIMSHRVLYNPELDYTIEEIRTINGRDYAIYAYENKIDSFDGSVLSAATIVDQQYFELNFSCWSADCSEFRDLMLLSLNSLRIVPNKENL